MTLSGTRRLGLDRRSQDLFRARDLARGQNLFRAQDPFRTQQMFLGQNDRYLGPRSADLRSPSTNPATDGRWASGAWPTMGFQSTSQVPGAWGTQRGASMSASDIRSYVEQRQKQLPPTTESLKQIVSELQAQGVPVVMATHAGGTLPSDDKIVLPNGQCVDCITDVGGSNPGWAFNADGGYDPNVNIVAPDGKMMKYGDWLTSQGLPVPAFTPSADAGGAGAMPQSFSDALAWLMAFLQDMGGVFSQPSAPPAGAGAAGGAAGPKAPSTLGTPRGDSMRQEMLDLLGKGVPPQDVADRITKEFGLGYGNSAVYYSDSNCIGLPDFYVAGTAKGWNIVER